MGVLWSNEGLPESFEIVTMVIEGGGIEWIYKNIMTIVLNDWVSSWRVISCFSKM